MKRFCVDLVFVFNFLWLLFDFLVSSEVSIPVSKSDLGAWLQSASEDTLLPWHLLGFL